MILVVGLGNPDERYARDRHNVGFMVVDRLAAADDHIRFRKKFSSEFAKIEIRNEDALLLKPQTYMNLSGDAVQPCAAFFKIPPSQVIVVHDELDVPFGEIRIKKGGGHAGHNGLRSIIQRLATPDFVRVRVGIGRPPANFKGQVADFVLSPFNTTEREILGKTVARAAKSVIDIATRGTDAAMKRYNVRPKKKKAAKPKPTPDASKASSEEAGADTAGNDNAETN